VHILENPLMVVVGMSKTARSVVLRIQMRHKPDRVRINGAVLSAVFQLKRRPAVSLQDIGRDADGDALSGFPHRVAREMRIPRGCLYPSVTEEPSDDRQALTQRERP